METETHNDDCCPECGSQALYREPQCTHGTEGQTTSGTACMDCPWYELDEERVEAPEDGHLMEGVISLGNKGTTTTEHPNFDEERMIYLDRGGCPECGDDLEIFLVKRDEPEAWTKTPEYRAFADRCTSYGEDSTDCSHRAP
mgnify:CR=1 FL=1